MSALTFSISMAGYGEGRDDRTHDNAVDISTAVVRNVLILGGSWIIHRRDD